MKEKIIKIPCKYKAKEFNGDKWYVGYYFQFPETTYCITEDYERNPPEIIHGLIFHQMTDWGLPNNLKWVRIDPDTLEEIVENEAKVIIEKYKNKSLIDLGVVFSDEKFFCSNCKYELDIEYDYCPKCGTKIIWEPTEK